MPNNLSKEKHQRPKEELKNKPQNAKENHKMKEYNLQGKERPKTQQNFNGLKCKRK